jgi:hypothetical protein
MRAWIFLGLLASLGSLVSQSVSAARTAQSPPTSQPCSSPTPIQRGPNGPEAQGSSTGGQFWALTPFLSSGTVDASEKFVLGMTGSGPLNMTAIGPAGEVTGPARLDFHGPATGNRPGEEWGSAWIFDEPGCWDMHAVRGNVTGDIWFNVAAPQFSLTSFAARQNGRTVTSVRPGVRTVFVVRGSVQNYSGIPRGKLIVRHGNRLYGTFTLRTPDVRSVLLRRAITFPSTGSSAFTITARVREWHLTATKTLHLRRSP